MLRTRAENSVSSRLRSTIFSSSTYATSYPNLPVRYCSGPLVLGHGKELLRRAELNELAQVEEGGEIGDAGRLGDIVGDLDYGDGAS